MDWSDQRNIHWGVPMWTHPKYAVAWLRRLSIWFKRRARGGTKRLRYFACAEARDLRRSLKHVGISNTDSTIAIPAIARAILEYDTRVGRRQELWGVFCLVMIYAPAFFLSEWNGFPGQFFLPNLSDDAKWFVRVLYLVLYFTFTTFAPLLLPQTADAKRWAKYLQQTTETRRNIPYPFKIPRLFKNRMNFIFAFVGLLLIYFSNVQDIFRYASKLDWSEIWIGTATALSGLLWSVTVGFIWYRGVGRLRLIRRAPDLALIRILADAFTSVVEAKPHEFRSFALRAKLSAYLRSAANLLDGQMVRMLAGGDKLAEGIVLPQLAGAAAGLRQKLGSLAMPVQNTREEIARLLGEALIAVASGNFAALPSAEAAVLPGGPALWRSRLDAFLRWCVIGLAPGLALLFGWSLIPDAALRGLLVQFAALCFVTATFSAIDPDGRNKLASVISTGTGLFGWGKG